MRYKVRKLTPTEYWRLMGFSDCDVLQCKAMGLSNTQLYRQAGNSIVTNCIELIGEHLYKAQYNKNYICTDERYETKSTDGCNQLGNMGGITGYECARRVYGVDGISPTLTTCGGGNREAKILVKQI